MIAPGEKQIFKSKHYYETQNTGYIIGTNFNPLRREKIRKYSRQGYDFFVCSTAFLSVVSNCLGFEDSLPNQFQWVWKKSQMALISQQSFHHIVEFLITLPPLCFFLFSFFFIPCPTKSSLTIATHIVQFVKGFRKWMKILLKLWYMIEGQLYLQTLV